MESVATVRGSERFGAPSIKVDEIAVGRMSYRPDRPDFYFGQLQLKPFPP